MTRDRKKSPSPRFHGRLVSLMVGLLVLAACSDDVDTMPDALPHDAGSEDATPRDTDPQEADLRDTDPHDSGADVDLDADQREVTPLAAVEDTTHHDHEMLMGETTTVFEAPEGSFASFPFAISHLSPTRQGWQRVSLSFAENIDSGGAEQQGRYVLTDDQGFHFQEIEQDVPLTNAVYLASGELLALDFKPTYVIDEHGDRTRAEMNVYVSDNSGETWTSRPSQFVSRDETGALRPYAGMRFHRGIIEIPYGPDRGVLLVPTYIRYGDEEFYSTILSSSSDNGETWEYWGTITEPDASRAENGVAFAANGELVAVTRVHRDGDLQPLEINRSSDFGRTFSEPTVLHVAFVGEPPGPRPGVNPHLSLLPNGVLVLAAGRLDNWVALSRDGLGYTWENAVITYVNYPVESRTRGSSGYQSVVSLSSNRLHLTGDNRKNCHDEDDDVCGGTGWTVDDRYRIWQRLLDVVPEDPGRMDLNGMVSAGRVAIETSMTSATVEHGYGVLFDGSLASTSCLVGGSDASHFIRIHFDRAYGLTRLGVANMLGSSSTTTVFVYSEGEWRGPVAVTGDRPDFAMRSFDFEEPVEVEVVEIQVEPRECVESCNPESDVGIAEIELYSTINSFENEGLFSTPRGFVEPRMAWITNYETDGSGQTLRLNDSSDSAQAFIAHPLPELSSATVSFRFRAIELPNSFLFGIAGVDAAGENVRAVHLGVFPDGALRRYDATTGHWEPVAESEPSLSLDGWRSLSVRASLNDAQLLVDGEHVASFDSSEAGSTSLTRFYFASAGTIPTGDHVLVDDVQFE